MKTAVDWIEHANKFQTDDKSTDEEILTLVQVDALRSAIAIADTFALNHKLSAPEVIVAIQIREQIERLVKEIET